MGLSAVLSMVILGIASPALAADTTPPVVGSVTPIVATAGQPITLSATYSDDTGVAFCQFFQPSTQTILSALSVSGLTSGTASVLYLFSSAGSYQVQWQCRDAAGNWGNGPITTVTVSGAGGTSGDTTPPSVGAVSPLSGTVGVSIVLSASVSDASGISSCGFYENSDHPLGTVQMNNVISGTAQVVHAYDAAGSYPVYVQCQDVYGNVQKGAVSNMVISATQTDSAAPSVGSIATPSPTPVVGGSSAIVASYSDNVGVTQCRVMENAVQIGSTAYAQPAINGNANVLVSFSSGGAHMIQMQCRDAAGNWGSSPSTSINVLVSGNGAAPSVGSVYPGSASTGAYTTYYASYSSAVGVNYCQLMNGSTVLGTVSYSPVNMSGTVNIGVTFTYAQTYALQMQCRDSNGSWGYGATTTVTVSSSGNPSNNNGSFVVGQVYLSSDSPMAGSSAWYYVSASDNTTISQCRLVLDGVDIAAMTQQNTGSYAFQYAFPIVYQDVAHTASARCTDSLGYVANSVSTKNFHVLPYTGSSSDGTAPYVGAVNPTYANPGVNTTFYASYSDTNGVTQCKMLVDGNVAWISSTFSAQTSGSTSLSYGLSQGSHTLQFGCVDAAGNWGYGQSTTVNVGTSSYGGDTQLPVVGMIDQSSVPSGVMTTLSSSVTDNYGSVSRCTLYVNGTAQGNMSLMNNVATEGYYFSNPGSYSLSVSCWDGAGNMGTSSVRTVYASYGQTTNGMPGPGSLIKQTCPAYAPPGHPCTAVYYYGTDGKRHGFPNVQIFHTWYPDFSGVLEVSDIFLANIPLGKNVQYRPGVRMVKFTTDPKVYAVTRRGMLRWVTSEYVASSIYGPYWNQMIDDLPDTLYSGYIFGSDITTPTSFVPSNEMSNVTSIDANF